MNKQEKEIHMMHARVQKTNWIGHALLCALFLISVGCTTPPPPSGFLSDYSRLQEDKYGDSSLLWWEKDNFSWTKYKKIMLDPVVVYYHPQAKCQQINPETVKKLTDYFRTVVEEELAGEFPVVTAPGSDVLKIRVALTEIVPANPAVNLVTSVAVFVPLDMGGASIEAEFLDSQSNELLAMMVDKKTGNPLDPKFYRGLTPMGYAKASFQSWATDLKKALKSNP